MSIHWEAIERALEEGPLTVEHLTPMIYGLDGRSERKAAALTLQRLAGRGLVVRIRAGYYALPHRIEDHNPLSRESLIDYITEHGRTPYEVAWRFGIHPNWALRKIRRLGLPLEVRWVGRSRWPGKKPIRSYRIRPDRATRATPMYRGTATRNGQHRCPKCEQWKPLTAEHFYIDETGRTRGYCRPCQRDYIKEYRASRAA